MNKKVISDIRRISFLMNLNSSVDVPYYDVSNNIAEQFEKIKPKDSDNTSVQKNYPYRDIPKIKISSSPSDPNEGKYYAYVDENGRDYNPFILTFDKQPSKNTRPISKELYNYLKNKELETKSNIEKNKIKSSTETLNYVSKNLAKYDAQEIFDKIESIIDYPWWEPSPTIRKFLGDEMKDTAAIVKTIKKEEVYLALLNILIDKAYSSLMEYITKFFPIYNEDEPEGNWYKPQYYKVDRYIVEISNHLKRFNYLNESEGVYKLYTTEDWYDDLVEDLHLALPIISLGLNMFGGVWGMIGGAVLELIDAGLYYFYDDDPYAAGLATIFAIVGPLDNVLAPYLKIGGKNLIKRLAMKSASKLSPQEKAILRYTYSNYPRLYRLCKMRMFRKGLWWFIENTQGIRVFVRLLLWLTEKGILLGSMMLNMGLIIGGGFVTWDYIAKQLGLCKSMDIGEIKQSDYKILKLLGEYFTQYIQPFTDKCNTAEMKKVLGQLEVEFENRRILNQLETLIEIGAVLSNKTLSQVKSNDTYTIQRVLKHFGLSYFVPDEKKVEKTVEKGVKWSKEKCLSQFTMSLDMYKLAQHPECEQYLKPNKKISKETETMLKSTPKNTKNSYEYGVIKTDFNWGYFDKQTTDMIKEFQKKYKLSLVDGQAGKEVFEKMKSLVESLGKKQIKKYVNFPWGDKERKKLALYIKQQVDKKFEGPNFTEEEIQNSYNSQKQQVHDSLDNEINNFVPPEFFKNDTIVEDTLNEMKRQADSE